MENQNQNEIFTTNFKAGQKMFFLNMCEAKNNSKYLKITESKMLQDGEYESHGIMIFEQDFEKLTKALTEAMSKIDTIVFDKTGTLTSQEKYQVAYQGDALSEDDMAIIKTMTKSSNHPLSRLIYQKFSDKQLFSFETVEVNNFFISHSPFYLIIIKMVRGDSL